jgi:hypothetical protein
MTRTKLYYPTDIERAAQRWQANCGPCSLAAVLGMPVQRVQALLPDWPGYTNITCMKAALARAKARVTEVGARLPGYGLVFLQWGGHDHKPVKAQYRYTHWIGIDRGAERQDTRRVFEVSAPDLITWQEWQRVMPGWMREEGQGDGTFRVRLGLEVSR